MNEEEQQALAAEQAEEAQRQAAAAAAGGGAAGGEDDPAVLLQGELDNATAEIDRLKAQLEQTQRAQPGAGSGSAGGGTTTAAPVDPFTQAAQEMEAQGINDWHPQYDRLLQQNALRIQSDRTKQEVLGLVGQVVVPLRAKDFVVTIAGDDPLQQEYVRDWVNTININNPKEVELLKLAAERYAEKKRPTLVNVRTDKSTTTPAALPQGVVAQAQQMATIAGVEPLTDQEIAAALAEAN